MLALFGISKAFDKIKHDIVLNKLIQLGVSEKFFHLLRDYLTARTQSVKINNCFSDKMSITSGVPQCSNPGPLFSLIYINNLPSVVFSSVALLFADDLKLIYSGIPEQLKRLQSDIEKLLSWSLLFNAKKCSLIEFAPGKNKRKTNVALLLGKEVLEQKTSSKDVGLIIKESLSWKEHVEYRISNAKKCLFHLKRNTHNSLFKTAKVHVYRAIINPILLFGSECWLLKKAEHKLIKNFNVKALKWISGNMNYIDSLMSTNLIQVLKVFLLYSNIINDYYIVDLTEHYKIKREGRQTRIILPTTFY